MQILLKSLFGLITIGAIMWDGEVQARDNGCDYLRTEYGMYTKHLRSDRTKLNEYNRFFGVQCDWLQFSQFVNSYYLDGWSAGVAVNKGFIGMGVGFIHGYDDNLQYFPDEVVFGDFLFYFTPEIIIGVENVSQVFGVSNQWIKQYGVEDVKVVGRLFGEVVTVNLAVVW